jgi:HAMP domain-containing protein
VRLFWKMYFSILISLVAMLSCFVVFISLKDAIGDNWSAWLGFLLKEASEKGAETVLPITLFFVAAIVILGIILYFSIKYFKKPIRELINGAHKIAEGDLMHRAPIHLEDEMGLLARAFNSMAEDL